MRIFSSRQIRAALREIWIESSRTWSLTWRIKWISVSKSKIFQNLYRKCKKADDNYMNKKIRKMRKWRFTRYSIFLLRLSWVNRIKISRIKYNISKSKKSSRSIHYSIHYASTKIEASNTNLIYIMIVYYHLFGKKILIKKTFKCRCKPEELSTYHPVCEILA